jgi:hypothetical protein
MKDPVSPTLIKVPLRNRLRSCHRLPFLKHPLGR